MKILIISNSFSKPNNLTMGSYIFSQVKALLNNGCEPFVVSPTIFVPKMLGVINQKLRGYSRIPKKYKMEEVEVLYPKITIYNQLNILYKILPDFKYNIYRFQLKNNIDSLLKKENFDVIYCHGPIMEGRLGIEIKNKLNIPLIVIEHSITSIKRLKRNSKEYNIYKNVLESCDKFICVSNKQKELLVNEFGMNEKIKVIYNGFKTCRNIEKNNRNDEEYIKIISVGFLEEQKGYLAVLEALKNIKLYYKDIKFKYTIIGEGKLKKDIIKLIKEYNLQEECILKGKIPHEKVIENMINSDIFVLPAYNESFGIVYLEAMSCGLPIIATKNEGISEIINPGKNGELIEKNNSDELVKCIINLIINNEYRIKIGKNGLNTASKFTWEENAKNLINEIKNI